MFSDIGQAMNLDGLPCVSYILTFGLSEAKQHYEEKTCFHVTRNINKL